MIKQLAWNTFKNTGDINSYLELVELENMQKNLTQLENQNGKSEIQGNINLK